MWFTNSFDNYVLSQLVLTNNSESFGVWQKPTVRPYYSVYIFNYTNVDEYRDGLDSKFHLKELGPYTFEEILERVEISYPTDDTMSFKDNRILKFRPDLSNGDVNDLLVVPNLAVITGSAVAKPLNYFTQLGFNAILSSLGEEAFLKIRAGDFLLGYTDQLYTISRTFLPDETPSRMGLLVPKIGTSGMTYTINTGKKDMNKYAIIEKINGEKEFDYFASSECNSIEATDGALHPPKLVQNKQTLHYMLPEACRRMPLIFEKETTVLDGKVPAYHYVHPEDIFDSAEEKPENQCYCNLESGACPLKGLFNVTSCSYDAPMFISHPHFHRADPRLLEPFTGLNPNGSYKSYFNIHPTMGFVMKARNILQLNVQVQKAASVSKMNMFEDGMILPIAWLEGILDDRTLPQNLIDTIELVTFTVPSIKLALKYGLLLSSIITLCSLVIVLRKKWQSPKMILPERLLRTGQSMFVTR